MARYIKKNGLLKPVSGAQFADTPIGTVIASFLAVAPSGYIKCDDTVYTKAQYPELYERIPDVFKDTTNETFTIDLREVALKGIGLSSLTTEHYSSTGLTLGQFIEDRLQNHAHDIMVSSDSLNYRTISSNSGNASGVMYGRNPGETRNLGAVNIYSGRHGVTTEVKAVGVNYFIKAKQIGVPADIMAGIEENFVNKDDIANTVASNNINPVSSDAVYDYLAAGNIGGGRLKFIKLELSPSDFTYTKNSASEMQFVFSSSRLSTPAENSPVLVYGVSASHGISFGLTFIPAWGSYGGSIPCLNLSSQYTTNTTISNTAGNSNFVVKVVAPGTAPSSYTGQLIIKALAFIK